MMKRVRSYALLLHFKTCKSCSANLSQASTVGIPKRNYVIALLSKQNFKTHLFLVLVYLLRSKR